MDKSIEQGKCLPRNCFWMVIIEDIKLDVYEVIVISLRGRG